MNKTLFIGGPKDGKREVWPHNGGVVQVSVADFGPPNPNPSTLLPDVGFGVTTHTYSMRKFVNAKGEELFVAVDSSITDIMGQLVKGYRYHRSPRYALTHRKLSRAHNQLKQAAI